MAVAALQFRRYIQNRRQDTLPLLHRDEFRWAVNALMLSLKPVAASRLFCLAYHAVLNKDVSELLVRSLWHQTTYLTVPFTTPGVVVYRPFLTFEVSLCMSSFPSRFVRHISQTYCWLTFAAWGITPAQAP